MDVIIEFIKNLTNADWIMAHGGLALVALIVFAETGLFVGFFLPGDSLLFIAGLILANSTQAFPFDGGVVDLIFWMAVIVIAGIVGNYMGLTFINEKIHGFLKRNTYFKRKPFIRIKVALQLLWRASCRSFAHLRQ
jgi:membrane-associated protein